MISPENVPQLWLDEIKKGSAFGKKVSAVLSQSVTTAQPARDRALSGGRGNPEPVGDAMAARIEGLLKVKGGSGCGCSSLAQKMNGWGIKGCEKRRNEIVGALVANRDILVKALSGLGGIGGKVAAMGAALAPEWMLKEGANWLLDMALEDVRKSSSESEIETGSRIPPRPPRRQRVSRAERQALAAENAKELARSKPLSSSAEKEAARRARAERQKRVGIRSNNNGRRPYSGWRSEADGPPISYGPFESKIRHLTYFVYPKSEESWQWNLQQLANRWWLFNGTKILGIAYDKKSADPQEVVEFAASLGMTFDHVLIKQNVEKLREVVLFFDMLKMLHPGSAGADEVVFSAHAKGQKYADPKHTRDWCDLMYQSCLDDWPAVYNALRTSLFAGSFREYGLLGRNHDWAYSGTFYWWRLAEIGKRNWHQVDQWFAGTESWPSKLCEARETACLFLNDSRRLYDAGYWKSTVWPEWRKYQERMKNGG